VCFNTNGLKRVAASISNPKLNLVVMADDDWQTKGNPGLTAAKWIQEHHGIDYVSPEWGDLPRQPKDSDYNDLLRLRGQHG
jgi:putative DNA primase/helicase